MRKLPSAAMAAKWVDFIVSRGESFVPLFLSDSFVGFALEERGCYYSTDRDHNQKAVLEPLLGTPSAKTAFFLMKLPGFRCVRTFGRGRFNTFMNFDPSLCETDDARAWSWLNSHGNGDYTILFYQDGGIAGFVFDGKFYRAQQGTNLKNDIHRHLGQVAYKTGQQSRMWHEQARCTELTCLRGRPVWVAYSRNS